MCVFIAGRNHESDFRHKERKKVTFKSNKYAQYKDGKDWRTAFREYLQDEDIDMGINAGTSGRVAHKKINKKGPKGANFHQNGKRPLLEGPSSWYKVQVRTYLLLVLSYNSFFFYSLSFVKLFFSISVATWR